MKNWRYLEDEFDGKDPSEHEVKVIENGVAGGLLVNRVFSSQSDATGADNDHDEQIKVAKVDNKVTETTNSAKTRTHR